MKSSAWPGSSGSKKAQSKSTTMPNSVRAATPAAMCKPGSGPITQGPSSISTRKEKKTMSKPNHRTIKQPGEHLFSPHTDQCIYCGQSAADDAVENTPCPPCKACDG